MKLAVLAVTLLFASCLDARFILWPQGKEFLYDYYGHFLSTVEDVGNRAVGIAVKAKVAIYSQSESDITVKLEEFKTASLNENVEDIDEDALPWKFQVAPGSLTTFVQMPFKARLVQGRLEQFEVSSEEPFESINIKKAILDLIQIDTSNILSPVSFPTPSYDVTIRSKSRSADRFSARRPNTLTPTEDEVDIVRYMEDGVIGKCESAYVISSDPSPFNPTAQVMNITKFRNYNDCERKPEWIRSSHVPVQCADCEAHDLHPYPTVHRVDFDIRRRGDELTIESIESEARTQFKPFTANSDFLLSNHSQILTLVRVKPLTTSVPQVTNVVTIKDLQYVFPTAHRALKAGGYNLKKPLVPFLNDKKINAVQEASTSFEKLLGMISDETTKSHYDELSTLEMYNCVRAIRLMNYDDINSFYSNVGLTKQSRDSSSLLADDRTQLFSQLLAMSGSAPSVLFIKYLVESQIITGELAVQVVQTIPTNIYEIPYELLNEILTFAKSRVVQDYHQLRKTVWLSFGILISKACNGPDDDIPTLPLPPHIRDFCPEEVERKFLQEIDQELRQAEPIDEVLLFMKVLSLTQLPSAVQYLEPFASGELADHETVQIAALRNLREIAMFSPEPVKEIAEKEFYDTDNPNTVRLAALRVLLASKPDYSDLQQIVAWADTESSDDISGYIVSFFKSMANATHYCLLDQANAAAQLLSFLDEEDENGIQGSNVFEWSQIFEQLGVSTQTYASWTKSNSSIIPESFLFRNNLTVAGFSLKSLQVHLHTKGLQTIIDRLIGPKGSFRKINSLEDLFRPEEEDEFKHRTFINDKLDLDSREEDSFLFNAFVKLGDTQARMFYADYKSIIEYFRSSRFDFSRIREGIPIHFHKLALMFEMQHQFPSILGMPIILNIFNPTIISVKGKVSVSIETKHSYIPEKVRLELEMKPSFQSAMGMRLGVYNPFDKELSVVGVHSKVYLNLPMIAQAEVNLLDGKFHFQLKPSTTQRVSLVDHSVKPFSCQYKLTTMNDNCHRPKIIHQDPEPDVTDLDLSETYLGLPLIFKSVSEHDWNDLASFLSEFREYDDLVTFFTTLWTLPEFAPRHRQLLINEKKLNGKSIDVTIAWEYKPSPSERKVLESRHSTKGIFTVLSGFATIPQRCGSKGPINIDSSDSSDDFWYLEEQDPKQIRPQFQSEDDDDDDFQEEFKFEDIQALKSKKKSPYMYSQDEERKYSYESTKYDVSGLRSSGARSESTQRFAPSVVERIPRANEVSELKLTLKAVAKGSDVQILASASLKRDLNALIDVAAVTFDFVNVPLISVKKLEICTTATVRYPEVPCDFHSRMNPDFVKPIVADLKTAWGPQCSTTPQISAKVRFEKSTEQHDLERSKSSWYHDQCQEDMRRKMKLSDACDLVQLEISSLNKVVLDAEFHQLPIWLKNVTHKVDTFLKVHNYHHMTNNPVEVRNAPNKLRVVAFLYDDVQAYDLQIFKPTENTFFKKVPFDQDVPYLFPMSTEVTMVEQFVDEVTDGYYEPSCKVMGDFINTFDNNTMKIPLSTCHHVIAKDCSRDDLFAVTMAKPDQSKQFKELNVYVLSHLIRAVPKGLYNGQFHLEIDSKIHEVSDDSVIALRTQDKDADNMIVAFITTTGPILHIQLPFTGLHVKFDGEDAEVIVSQFWRGKVCGVCGEFREETDEDMLGPKQFLYPDPLSFGISYGLQDYGCKLPSPPNPNKMFQDDYYKQSRVVARSSVHARAGPCNGNQFYPYPGDCTKFYHCDGPTPYVKDCPPGLHWNTKINVCDWPANANCRA